MDGKMLLKLNKFIPRRLEAYIRNKGGIYKVLKEL